MNTLKPAMALLALALSGCGTNPNAPTQFDASSVALSKAASTDAPRSRPLAGSCETVLSPAEILAPGVMRQEDIGSCRLSHLGNAQFTSIKVIQLATGTQTTEAMFVAANGDVLRAVGTGTNVPSGPGRIAFQATLTFDGGTGRFAEATGEAHVEGEADLVGREASLTLKGWISYDASDRSGR